MPSSISRQNIVVLAIATLALAGCVATGENREAETDEPTTVRVENDQKVAAVIYAVRSGGQRQRLGRVSAYGEEVIELPRTLVSPNGVSVRFLVELLGVDRPPVSREVVIYPGDEVGLSVPSL